METYLTVNSDLFQITYTNGDTDLIEVTTKFGDRYTGFIQNGKVVCKSRIGLGYLTRAYREFLEWSAN